MVLLSAHFLVLIMIVLISVLCYLTLLKELIILKQRLVFLFSL